MFPPYIVKTVPDPAEDGVTATTNLSKAADPRQDLIHLKIPTIKTNSRPRIPRIAARSSIYPLKLCKYPHS